MGMMETDYLQTRERQERARAEEARDMAARRVHLEMAELYSARVREHPEMRLPAQG